MGIQRLLMDRIHLGDRVGANELLDGWASEHGRERLIAEVLEPVLMLMTTALNIKLLREEIDRRGFRPRTCLS